MEVRDFGGIAIDPKDFYLDGLIEELGGKDKVRFVEGRGRKLILKMAEIDETQIAPESAPGADDAVTARDLAQAIIDAHDRSASSVQSDKTERITERADLMDLNILIGATAIFGRPNPLAHFANILDIIVREKYAAEFVGAGLKVHKTTTSFGTIGAALSTEVDIRNYHDELMKEYLVQLSKDRQVEMDNYSTDKASIEAE